MVIDKIRIEMIRIYGHFYSNILMIYSLAPLVKKVREPQLQEIVDQLCSYTTQQGKEELRDIAGIGIIILCYDKI